MPENMKEHNHATQKNTKHARASQAVLARIADKKITPRPRWHFLVREGVMWSAGIGAVVLGALTASLMLLVLSNNVWELRGVINPKTVWSLLLIAPLIWIGLVAFFLLIAERSLCKTKHGYRYPLWIVVSLPLVTSIALGMALYHVGVSYAVDEILEHRVPYYKSFEHKRSAMLHEPEEGQISGVVMEKSDAQILVVRRFDEAPWSVDASRLPVNRFEKINVGDHVVVFGTEVEVSDANTEAFVACAVHLLPRKGFRKERDGMKKAKTQRLQGDTRDTVGEVKRGRSHIFERREDYGAHLEDKINNFPPCVRLRAQGAST